MTLYVILNYEWTFESHYIFPYPRTLSRTKSNIEGNQLLVNNV